MRASRAHAAPARAGRPGPRPAARRHARGRARNQSALGALCGRPRLNYVLVRRLSAFCRAWHTRLESNLSARSVLDPGATLENWTVTTPKASRTQASSTPAMRANIEQPQSACAKSHLARARRRGRRADGGRAARPAPYRASACCLTDVAPCSGAACPSRVTTVSSGHASPTLGPVTSLPPGWRFPGHGKEAAACASVEVPAWPQGRGRGIDHAVPGLVLHVLLARGRPAALAGPVASARPGAQLWARTVPRGAGSDEAVSPDGTTLFVPGVLKGH
jgi:hypothetical protein